MHGGGSGSGSLSPCSTYAGVGAAWVLIAVVLDYLFIVLMFQATYYGTDVFVYYTLTFLIPVGVGLYLKRNRTDISPAILRD